MNKLYLWRDVFADYSPGCAFALAPDLDTAVDLIARENLRPYLSDEGALERVRNELRQAEHEVHECTSVLAFSRQGGS